jgi:hypothetical protein
MNIKKVKDAHACLVDSVTGMSLRVILTNTFILRKY